MKSSVFKEEASKEEFKPEMLRIKKEEDNEINRSFVSDFYYNWFEDMKDISNGKYNGGQSRVLNQMYEPYIKGVVDSLPKESQESVGNVLTTVATSYEKQSVDNQQQNNIKEAEESNKISIIKSEKMALDSFKEEEPEEVSTLKSSMHMNILKENLKAGTISPEAYVSLVSDYSQGLIANNLSKILLDENISARKKFKEIQKFVYGKTGEEAIDVHMDPREKLQIVSQVMGFASQANAYREKVANEESAAKKALFDNKYMESAIYLATKGINDQSQINQLKQNLYKFASDPDDFKSIANLGSVAIPTTTAPLTTLLIDEEKKKGTWSEEKYKNLIYNNQLSSSDAIKYGEELQQPANLNFKLIPDVEAQARADTGYSLDNQEDYNEWYAMVMSDKDFASAPQSRDVAKAIGLKYLNEKRKTLSSAKSLNRYKINKQYEGTGLIPVDANRFYSSAMTEAAQEYKVDNPTFDKIKPFLEQKLKDDLELRTKKGTAQTVTGINGEIISNPELIIKLQSAIIEKNIHSNWESK